MNLELVKLDQARQLLADCNDIKEAKKFHDIAEAARHYAKVQGLGLESANYATEIKIRAERKMGELPRPANLEILRQAVSKWYIEADRR